MTINDPDLKKFMRAALDGTLTDQNAARRPAMPWTLLQVDTEDGGREDYSVFYNPVIMVLRGPNDTDESIEAAATALISRIITLDPDWKLGLDAYREVLVAALRAEGYTVAFEGTRVIDLYN